MLAHIDWDVAEHWWEGGGGAMFGHQCCLKGEKKRDHWTIFTCAMYEAARERPPTVTPSFLEEKIVPIKILATMLLTFKFDEPAASPNSLVVCWISFPRKQSFKQENQPSLVKSQQVM